MQVRRMVAAVVPQDAVFTTALRKLIGCCRCLQHWLLWRQNHSQIGEARFLREKRG